MTTTTMTIPTTTIPIIPTTMITERGIHYCDILNCNFNGMFKSFENYFLIINIYIFKFFFRRCLSIFKSWFN